MKINETPKKFHRTMADAFPDERANTITCYKRTPMWHVIVRSIAILTAIVITLLALLLWLMPK